MFWLQDGALDVLVLLDPMLFGVAGQHQGQSTVTGDVAGSAEAVLQGKDGQHQGGAGVIKHQHASDQAQRGQGRDEKGKMTAIEYTIYEQPQSPGSHSPGLENPTPGKPILENPIPGNPTSENPTQLNKDISKTNLPKLALLPLLLLLILAQWVGIFLTTFSTVLTNLLAGLFFFVALACWIMKLADGGEVLKMLITAFVVFVLPYIAIAAIAKISFFAEELRDFLQS